jgi:hypothetical protein
MRVGELNARRRVATEPRPAPRARAKEPSRPPSREAPRPPARARRQLPERTGFEPFLIAAVLGLCIWALILLPLFV